MRQGINDLHRVRRLPAHPHEARVEATTESYEDEDGHVRIYPPAGFSEGQILELEGQIAERCVDILVDTGILLCAAVYEPDT